MRRWELVGDGSSKFWEAEADGVSVRVRYGRIGSDGRLQVKEFADAGAAAGHLAKLVAEKERKGYRAVGGAEVPAEAVEPAEVAVEVVGAAEAAEPVEALVEVVGLPDEDVFVLPGAWRPWVVPRRGGTVPVAAWRPVWDAAGAVAEEERQLAEEREPLELALASEESDPEAVRVVRAHLAGVPDPLGAVGVARLLRSRADEGWARRLVDSWVVRFGLGFALRASLRLFDLDVHPVRERWRTGRVAFAGAPPIATYHLSFQFGVLAAVREVLAGVGESAYREALAELDGALDAAPGGGFDPALRRAVAAYLAPERAQVVDGCLAEGSDDPLVRTLLAYALGSAEQVERFGGAGGLLSGSWRQALVSTLADGAGLAAAELVRVGAAPDGPGYDSQWYAECLGAFPTDRVMAEMVDRIADKHVRVALLEAARRQPVRAVRVLAAAARRGGGAGSTARRMLNGHVGALRSRLPELLSRLDGESADFVRTLEGAREPLPEAGPELLPELLVAPPWSRPRTVRKARVLTGLSVDESSQLLWAEGELAEFAGSAEVRWQLPLGADWAAEAERARTQGSVWYLYRVLMQGPVEVMTPLLASWDRRALLDIGLSGQPLLAKYGTAVLPMLHEAARSQPAQTSPVLLPVLDAAAAGVMADVLVRLKSVQPVARSWFARHGVAGALLLVPAAVGKAGRARAAAEHALRLVAAQEGAEVLLAAVAERYGAEAAAVVGDALGSDPLENALPAKLPEFPDWLRPEVLPQLQLADGGGALPVSAVRHLVTALQLGRPREPYPGLAAVAEVLRADTAAAFGWAVFEEWWQAGMPSKDGWALHALGGFGDDDTARRLAPLLREWPGQGAHQRAVEGLDVLAEIGTDVALMQLHGIAQRVKFKALKARAQEKIAEIAEALDLTPEQLGDRLVPDLGLDEDGTTVIDYGTRTFTVGFDEQLRPYVLDADGKRRKDLPAPGAKDDPELAPAERKRFAALKKDVRTLAADQIARLEAAMVTERAWSASEFRTLLLGHPLLWHLVRRLVWTADGTAFRVAEDRTLADLHDEEYTLPEDAVVRLAHPLRLGADTAAWAEVFADYELLQPFRQLGRPVVELTEEEGAGHRLHRFERRRVPVGRLLGLTKRGWQRGTPQDAGVERWFYKPLPAGRCLVLDLNPGIAVGIVNELGDQSFDAVWLGTSPGDYWPGHRTYDQRLADLDRVTASELLADLEELTAD
ncbi:WGR and DUF4132 domain-containing protein [Kitasatospora cineracea]|uniref:WGR and DUF4132 domain-containing protein n=1 Tax=Kitasatospora cineracea TaxID=88074 RepID=UPI0036DF1D74